MPAETFGVLVSEAKWPEVQRLMCARGKAYGLGTLENTKPNAHAALVALIRRECRAQLAEERAEPGVEGIE